MENQKKRPKPRNLKKFNLLVHSILLGIIVIAVAALAGCGIQSFPYLSPPAASTIYQPLEGGKIFFFGNNTANNNTIFIGYEIYYKFYSTDPFNSQYDQETDKIELDPSWTNFQNYQYERLYNKDDVLTAPLISLTESEKDSDFLFEIDFSFLLESFFPVISYLDKNLSVARYTIKEGEVTEVESIYNFVPSQLTEEYQDFSSNLVSTQYDEVYLSLYVFSYGKYDAFNPIYSEAAHLGRIKLSYEKLSF